MVTIRRAQPDDFAELALILNEHVEDGCIPMSDTELLEWMRSGGNKASWWVAIENDSIVVGFQFIEPSQTPSACEIATFVRKGHERKGIGSLLFAQTKQVALDLGYLSIHATIREDNVSGLHYYSSRGFQSHGLIKNHQLENGKVVNKVIKRLELT